MRNLFLLCSINLSWRGLLRPDFKLPRCLCKKHSGARYCCFPWAALPCSRSASLPGYRPCRRRRRRQCFPLMGESSTLGNIPTGVALISRSQGSACRAAALRLSKERELSAAPATAAAGCFRAAAPAHDDDLLAARVESRRIEAPPRRRERRCCHRSISRLHLRRYSPRRQPRQRP